MSKIKLIENYNGNPKGTVVIVRDALDAFFLDNGIAELVKEEEEKKQPENKAIKPRYKKKK